MPKRSGNRKPIEGAGDYTQRVQDLRNSFDRLGDFINHFNTIYVQDRLKSLVEVHNISSGELSRVLDINELSPLAIDFSFDNTADGLYIVLSLQTKPLLTVEYIDKLKAEHPDIKRVVKRQLTSIKQTMQQYGSDSLRKDLIVIQDDKVAIDGHVLPVRRSIKYSLPTNAADFDADEQRSYAQTILSFIAGLMNKRFVYDDWDELLKGNIDAKSRMNKKNHVVLDAVYDIFGFDYVIPLSFTNNRYVILQITKENTVFRCIT